MIQEIAIIGYCLFQIAGCFFVGRAIFRMVVERRKELKAVPIKKVSNDIRRNG